MKTRPFLAIAVVAVLLALAVTTFPVAADPDNSIDRAEDAPVVRQWEYKVVSRDELFGVRDGACVAGPLPEVNPKDAVAYALYKHRYQNALNAMGEQGWESCSYAPGQDEFVFKRAVRQ